MNRSPLRPPPTSVSPTLLLGDIAMVALCLTAVFWLLVSPLIPIMFSEGELIIWTLLLGIPLSVLGIYLNHRAATGPGPRRGKTRG